MTDIDALIEKLEAATEGHRGLDREIAEDALGLITEWEALDGRAQLALMVKPLENVGYSELPYFTTSLDAALTLVPENVAAWHVGFAYNGGPYDARVFLLDTEKEVKDCEFEAFAQTAPIALCIAALRAIKAKETSSAP